MGSQRDFPSFTPHSLSSPLPERSLKFQAWKMGIPEGNSRDLIPQIHVLSRDGSQIPPNPSGNGMTPLRGAGILGFAFQGIKSSHKSSNPTKYSRLEKQDPSASSSSSSSFHQVRDSHSPKKTGMGNSRVPEGGKSGVFPEFQCQKQRKGDKYLSKGKKNGKNPTLRAPAGPGGVSPCLAFQDRIPGAWIYPPGQERDSNIPFLGKRSSFPINQTPGKPKSGPSWIWGFGRAGKGGRKWEFPFLEIRDRPEVGFVPGIHIPVS